VNDLIVDGHLEPVVIDDQDTDASASIIKGLSKAVEQTTLVKDRETLLDVTSLGHGDNAAVLADVKNTVLFKNRTKHVLNNNRWSWVRDEAGLFMKLLGEQINTEVAVLAGLGRGGDADDLARAALKDQEIANADVVTGDSDGVGRRHLARIGDASLADSGRRTVVGAVRSNRGSGGSRRRARSGVLLLDYDLLAAIVVLRTSEGVVAVVMVVVAVTVDGMDDVIGDLVGSLGDTVTERVVVTVFVVISHITLVLLRCVNRSSSFYSNLFPRRVAGVDSVNLTTGRIGAVLGG
jgi:hypothetical protein